MKNLKYALFLLALLAFASPMFAQTPAASGGGMTHADWVSIAACFSMAIASGLCALGQGNAVNGAAQGIARNPGATAAIRFALILGLVLIESLALYVFAIIFIKT